MPARRILAIGVFDLFHVGHLRFLQYARKQGAHLSVAVCTDAISLQVKGVKPAISQDQRLEIIRGLGCVNIAQLQPCSTNDARQSAIWIKDWGIEHVVGGGSWQGSDRWNCLTAELAEREITVGYAPHTEDISTSLLRATLAHISHT